MNISVIIPAFNEEKIIEKCLKSVINQTEKPFEIIVVDNNSTDKTAEIAKKFGARIVEEKIQGRRPARDAGFNAAKGDIIARTDADTIVPNDWIQKIHAAFENDDELLGFSGSGRFTGIPKFIQVNNCFVSGSSFFVKLLMKHDGMMGFNMALRKSTWNLIKDEVCLDDKKVHEDMDLAIHIARLGKVFFDKTLVVNTMPRQLKNVQTVAEYIFRGFTTAHHHRKRNSVRL
jgi:glycosyltransferase involved in cell wall biosynthesis